MSRFKLSTICARKSAVLGLINKSLILPEKFLGIQPLVKKINLAGDYTAAQLSQNSTALPKPFSPLTPPGLATEGTGSDRLTRLKQLAPESNYLPQVDCMMLLGNLCGAGLSSRGSNRSPLKLHLRRHPQQLNRRIVSRLPRSGSAKW
jgi:hypothetical protein